MLCLLFGQLYMLYMCMVIGCILCIYAPAWKEKVQFGCQSSEWKYLCRENQIVVGSYLDQIFAYGNKAQWSAGSVTGGLMATCGIFDLVGQTTLAQASRASPQRQLHTTGRLGHLTMFHAASSIHSLSLTKLDFQTCKPSSQHPKISWGCALSCFSGCPPTVELLEIWSVTVQGWQQNETVQPPSDIPRGQNLHLHLIQWCWSHPPAAEAPADLLTENWPLHAAEPPTWPQDFAHRWMSVWVRTREHIFHHCPAYNALWW